MPKPSPISRPLRKLQTERHIRILQLPDGQVPTDLGLTDSRPVVRTAVQSTQTIDANRAAIGAATEAHRPRSALPGNSETIPQPPLGTSSFCKSAQSAPATAQKPIGSSFCKTPAGSEYGRITRSAKQPGGCNATPQETT